MSYTHSYEMVGVEGILIGETAKAYRVKQESGKVGWVAKSQMQKPPIPLKDRTKLLIIPFWLVGKLEFEHVKVTAEQLKAEPKVEEPEPEDVFSSLEEYDNLDPDAWAEDL